MGKLEGVLNKLPEKEKEKFSKDGIRQLRWIASLGTNLGEAAVVKLIPDDKKDGLTADNLYKILSEKTGQDPDEEIVALDVDSVLKSINPKTERPKLVINSTKVPCTLDKGRLVIPREYIGENGNLAAQKDDPGTKVYYFEVTTDKELWVAKRRYKI